MNKIRYAGENMLLHIRGVVSGIINDTRSFLFERFKYIDIKKTTDTPIIDIKLTTCFVLSLGLHLCVLAFMLYEGKTRSMRQDIGGIDAEFSDSFESVQIVSKLPIGLLKEVSIAQKKSKISPQSQEKSTDEKKDANALTKEKDINSTHNLIAGEHISPKEANEKTSAHSSNAPASTFDNDKNAPQKETSATAPLAGKSTAVKSPIKGSGKNQAKSYQGILMGHLMRFQRYPSQSLALEQEGVSFVRVTMNKAGEVLGVAMEKRSGFELLDKESLALFSRASPLPSPPDDLLKGREEVTFSMPIRFNVKEFLARER